MLSPSPNQSIEEALNHAWIERHIPHQGKMCLLKSVKFWDQDHIICVADSHKLHDNPLRAYARLGIACGIEYAAQAMAVHGALLAPSSTAPPKVGYLVSVRGVTMAVTRLDNINSDLLISAVCIMASDSNMLYEFTVVADDKLLLTGRAAVMLNADALAMN